LKYTVWCKDVSKGEPIKLGPPHVSGEGGDKAMYGIVVKALTQGGY